MFPRGLIAFFFIWIPGQTFPPQEHLRGANANKRSVSFLASLPIQNSIIKGKRTASHPSAIDPPQRCTLRLDSESHPRDSLLNGP